MTSILDLTNKLNELILEKYGIEKEIDILGFSMGGIIGRHWLQKFSSKHTDGIITENLNSANKFMNTIDSAGVFHNCSTRFADGFRYGFGAEVGISTQTLPPRGPVGLEGLVTYKYFLKGDGNIVDDFSSGEAIYTHKDL